MKCERALHLIDKYIDNKLSPRELREFIEHVRSCPECYDELETFYVINVGMKYFDEEKLDSYNFPKMLKQDLEKKTVQLQRRKLHLQLLIVLGGFVVVWIVLFLLHLFGILQIPSIW